MFIFSPLESYYVTPIIISKTTLFTYYYLTLTNYSLMFIFIILALLIFTKVILSRYNISYINNWQTVLISLYLFVINLITENMGSKGWIYFPLIFTIFLLILFSNLIGLLPYTLAVTSHLVITEVMALMIFITCIWIGLYVHGVHFFSFFRPKNSPIALAPILIIIEFISFMFRPISLSVRLFANIMAGHTLLKIIMNFIWIIFDNSGFLPALVPFILLTVLMGLELLVAVLQAYVFTILMCIYIKDVIELH
jgi:ATP synthase subunit 6